MIMVTLARLTLARRAARTPLAPVVGVMFGLVAAILVAAVPGWMFERAVVDSGLPHILSHAGPPLGLKARVLAMGLAFALVGGGLWVVLSQIERMLKAARGRRSPWHDGGYAADDAPLQVEAHRRPIFAPSELGAPLMSDEAIGASLPALEPKPEAELSPILDPASELEAPLTSIEFDPPAPAPAKSPESATSIADDNSIQALIRRLESGLARRAANDPGPESPSSAPLPLSRDWIVHESASDTNGGGEDSGDVSQFLGQLKKLASR
jgi:hypothetical protein